MEVAVVGQARQRVAERERLELLARQPLAHVAPPDERHRGEQREQHAEQPGVQPRGPPALGGDRLRELVAEHIRLGRHALEHGVVARVDRRARAAVPGGDALVGEATELGDRVAQPGDPRAVAAADRLDRPDHRLPTRLERGAQRARAPQRETHVALGIHVRIARRELLEPDVRTRHDGDEGAGGVPPALAALERASRHAGRLRHREERRDGAHGDEQFEPMATGEAAQQARHALVIGASARGWSWPSPAWADRRGDVAGALRARPAAARAARWRRRAPSAARRSARVSARSRAPVRASVVPGRMRPSAGGVYRIPSRARATTLARLVSSTRPSASTSSGMVAGSSRSCASSRRRSRHLCGPSPPGSTTGRSTTVPGPGGGPDTTLTSSSGVDVDAQACTPGQRARGLRDDQHELRGRREAVEGAQAPGEAGEVIAEVRGHPVLDEQGLEQARGGIGAGQRPRAAAHDTLRLAARRGPRYGRADGGEQRRRLRGRLARLGGARPSRPRRRRRRRARCGPPASRTCGWRRSARARRAGSPARSRRCRPRARSSRARR